MTVLTAQQVRDIQFDMTRFRKGYSYVETDELIERIADALDGKDGLTSQDVRRAVMPTVRIRQGYDMAQVDNFLEDAAESLEAHALSNGQMMAAQ